MRQLRHIILRYKYPISIVLFAAIIGFVGEHSLVKRFAQKQEIAELRNNIQNEIDTYTNDKQKLERIKNNPEAVKRVAHEKYYMKTEDEDIFVITAEE